MISLRLKIIITDLYYIYHIFVYRKTNLLNLFLEAKWSYNKKVSNSHGYIYKLLIKVYCVYVRMYIVYRRTMVQCSIGLINFSGGLTHL